MNAGLIFASDHGFRRIDARESLWRVGLPWRAKESSMKKKLSAGVAAETQKLVLPVNPTEISAGSGGVASYWYVKRPAISLKSPPAPRHDWACSRQKRSLTPQNVHHGGLTVEARSMLGARSPSMAHFFRLLAKMNAAPGQCGRVQNLVAPNSCNEIAPRVCRPVRTGLATGCCCSF